MIYSFINIAGLSLGLTCAMLIILYVKDEVSYDRFQKNGSRIYHIVRKLENPDGRKTEGDGYTGYPQGPQFTQSIPEIKGFVRPQNNYNDIQKGAEY